MIIKEEFYQYLLEKGLNPKVYFNSWLTFYYKENSFTIRRLYKFSWIEYNSLFSDFDTSQKEEMFYLVLYNEYSYERRDKCRNKHIDIATNINFRYRGIKAIVQIEEDYHMEIRLELLKNFSKELKNSFFEYLDIMILANNEVTKYLKN